MNETWAFNKEAGTMRRMPVGGVGAVGKLVPIPPAILEAIRDIPDVASVSITVTRPNPPNVLTPPKSKTQDIYFIETVVPAESVGYNQSGYIVKVRARITTKPQNL